MLVNPHIVPTPPTLQTRYPDDIDEDPLTHVNRLSQFDNRVFCSATQRFEPCNNTRHAQQAGKEKKVKRGSGSADGVRGHGKGAFGVGGGWLSLQFGRCRGDLSLFRFARLAYSYTSLNTYISVPHCGSLSSVDCGLFCCGGTDGLVGTGAVIPAGVRDSKVVGMPGALGQVDNAVLKVASTREAASMLTHLYGSRGGA